MTTLYRDKHAQTSPLVHALGERKEWKVNIKSTDEAGKRLRNAATQLSARFGSGRECSFFWRTTSLELFFLLAVGFSLTLFHKVAQTHASTLTRHPPLLGLLCTLWTSFPDTLQWSLSLGESYPRLRMVDLFQEFVNTLTMITYRN